MVGVYIYIIFKYAQDKNLCFITECKKLPLQLPKKVKGDFSTARNGLTVCKICSTMFSGSSANLLLDRHDIPR